LAEAVMVPVEYMDELIAGTRRPPRPANTDIYARITSFLRLGRRDMAACAIAEHASLSHGGPAQPRARVRDLLLELCERSTAQELVRRRTRIGATELAGFFERVLAVAQAAVRRSLNDHAALRVEAAAQGMTFVAVRFRVLEFLEATTATVSVADLNHFLRSRIARWDVDLDTGVVRIVMQAGAATPRPAR
jgi:hypothetical protein